MTRFRSGFTRWIEQRLLRDDPDDLIEAIGFLARTEGLSPDVAEHVATMTGTMTSDVVAAYQADNTEWASTQATFDHPDLTALDDHLDTVAYCRHQD
ncbi:hypothetical protein [Streptosporangium roseum]|uniref:Uncharacterized protein n=1 Tax=Streptosporangium roseum (strain ATCC 12428 / DSM 43021 / JCM 3005 / KCTC 9067 / NCIMB 10171 / NRRL 2505 / NI 9100) TaxID=479432 RepID=D2AS45_STRRD|nr:hypothetical protein [Streptosporangium roseum]ACZ86572.1 hypothetical protein Sros_3643 [Streptosporangium roseum DSM 43021]